MTSELNIYTVHFQLSSADGGELTTDDFNNLERRDLRNCSSLNICFEPEEITIPDVKITKMFIHYDGIFDSPQHYFGFEYDHDLDQGFKGSPNPIVTFELNKEVDPGEFRKSIWMSSICIFPEKVQERNGEAAFQQDNSGYTSIIDQKQLDRYIKQLSGAAIEPPKEISFPNGLDGYYKFELKELIGLNKPSQKKPKKTTKQLLRAIKKISNDPHAYLGPSIPDYLKKEADKSLKSDREFILAALKIDTDSFPFASKKLRSDREIVLAAVKDGYNLQFADKKMQSDREIVLAAVRQDGKVLQFVDQKLRSDREILLAAIGAKCGAPKNPFILLPNNLKSDQDFILAACANWPSEKDPFMFLPKNLKSDRDFVLAAVRQDGKVLQFVDKKFRSDREIVLAAVMNDGVSNAECAFIHVDVRFKLYDREIILAAVRQKGKVLKFVDEKFKSDREIVLTAVRQDSRAILYADEKFKSDREIILAAVSQVADGISKNSGGYTLACAGKELMYDMEIIFASFKSTPKALKYLHIYGFGKFKIDETIIRELRKKFGEKLINKYLDPDERDLDIHDEGSEEYNNLMELRKMMKR